MGLCFSEHTPLVWLVTIVRDFFYKFIQLHSVSAGSDIDRDHAVLNRVGLQILSKPAVVSQARRGFPQARGIFPTRTGTRSLNSPCLPGRAEPMIGVAMATLNRNLTRVTLLTVLLSLRFSIALAQTYSNFAIKGGTSGEYPTGIVFSNGALFGGTEYGGNSKVSGGVVFKITPPAAGTSWKETVLNDLNPATGEVNFGVLAMPNGTLYGVAANGGMDRGRGGRRARRLRHDFSDDSARQTGAMA